MSEGELERRSPEVPDVPEGELERRSPEVPDVPVPVVPDPEIPEGEVGFLREQSSSSV